MDDHDGHGDPRFLGVYGGVVTRNDDPKKIGRIQFTIPGMVEPHSGWALPFTIGGGGEEHGIHFVPKVDSEVACWFHMGDPDEPRYLGGNPRARGGVSGLNERVRNKSAEDVPKVKLIESERWLIVLDDTDTTPALLLVDKVLNDGFEYNGLTRQMTINATAGIEVRSTGPISIDGLTVTINGRPVLASSEPI
jgi:hypothetical protein